MKYLLLIFGLFILNFTYGQHLYPEKFNECKLTRLGCHHFDCPKCKKSGLLGFMVKATFPLK